MRSLVAPFRLLLVPMLIAFVAAGAPANAQPAPEAGPAPDVVRFADLTHLSLGAATLSLDDESLRVEGIGDSGADGVLVRLPAARSWSAEAEVLSQEGGFMRLAAVAAKWTVSTLDLEAVGNELSITPAFGSPTYSVEIFLGGVYVAHKPRIPTPEPVFVDASWWHCERDLLPREQCRKTVGFDTGPSDPCSWRLVSPSGTTRLFRFPDGSVVEGDEIRMKEDEAGAAPMGFTEMRIEAAQLDSLRILDERAERWTGAVPR